MLLLSKERESSAELSRHIFLKTGTIPHVTLQGLGGRLGETGNLRARMAPPRPDPGARPSSGGVGAAGWSQPPV